MVDLVQVESLDSDHSVASGGGKSKFSILNSVATDRIPEIPLPFDSAHRVRPSQVYRLSI